MNRGNGTDEVIRILTVEDLVNDRRQLKILRWTGRVLYPDDNNDLVSRSTVIHTPEKGSACDSTVLDLYCNHLLSIITPVITLTPNSLRFFISISIPEGFPVFIPF